MRLGSPAFEIEGKRILLSGLRIYGERKTHVTVIAYLIPGYIG